MAGTVLRSLNLILDPWCMNFGCHPSLSNMTPGCDTGYHIPTTSEEIDSGREVEQRAKCLLQRQQRPKTHQRWPGMRGWERAAPWAMSGSVHTGGHRRRADSRNWSRQMSIISEQHKKRKKGSQMKGMRATATLIFTPLCIIRIFMVVIFERASCQLPPSYIWHWASFLKCTTELFWQSIYLIRNKLSKISNTALLFC